MIGNLRVVRDQRPIYSTKPKRGGTLTMVRVGRSNSDFNPASFAQDFQIPSSYLEPLVWIEGVTMEPQPWLATSWTWNKDRTEVEYKLQDGVAWHDGETFTARDVAFSFTVYRDDIYSAAANLFTNMASVEAVDDSDCSGSLVSAGLQLDPKRVQPAHPAAQAIRRVSGTASPRGSER